MVGTNTLQPSHIQVASSETKKAGANVRLFAYKFVEIAMEYKRLLKQIHEAGICTKIPRIDLCEHICGITSGEVQWEVYINSSQREGYSVFAVSTTGQFRVLAGNIADRKDLDYFLDRHKLPTGAVAGSQL